MSEEQWQCVCGETDINKHDLGMVIAHEYELSEQQGRDILVRIRDRVGVETAPEDFTPPGDPDLCDYCGTFPPCYHEEIDPPS